MGNGRVKDLRRPGRKDRGKRRREIRKEWSSPGVGPKSGAPDALG